MSGTRAVAEERAAPVVPEELHAVPVSIADVNSKNLLGYASDLGPDHPGFHDEEYKRRRTEIVEIALDHQLYVTLTHINTLCTCMDKTLRVICRARCTHICAFFPAQPFSDALLLLMMLTMTTLVWRLRRGYRRYPCKFR